MSGGAHNSIKLSLRSSIIVAFALIGVWQPSKINAETNCSQPVRLDFDGIVSTRVQESSTTVDGIFVFYQYDRRLVGTDGELTISLNGQTVWSDLKVACADFRDLVTVSTPRRVIFGWRFGPQVLNHPEVSVMEARFRPKFGSSIEMRKDMRPR